MTNKKIQLLAKNIAGDKVFTISLQKDVGFY
jgi:hypothetical protein